MNRGAAIATLVPLVGIGILVGSYWQVHWTSLRVAGLVLMVVGLALLTIARFQLGDSFSLSPQARKLVTDGIYSRIRNPIYVFGMFIFAGLFTFLDQPYLFLFFLLIIPLQFFRARAESRVLEQRFGEEYRQYKAMTWF